MSANGCLVPIPGAGLCGWERDGRHMECAAHRRRLRVHGDYLAHVPVTRKPSRRPFAVAQRQAAKRVYARRAKVTRERQVQLYDAQLAALALERRTDARRVAALA